VVARRPLERLDLEHQALDRGDPHRVTPIPAGDPVRVASIEGLVLEVEPLEGAARDHRERRSN